MLTVSNKQIFPTLDLCKKLSFLSENLRVLRKYETGGHGDYPWDCTGGQHPCLDGSRLCHHFFMRKFHKYFFGKIYINQKHADW